MALDLLALPEPLSAGAGPALERLTLIYCQDARWAQIPLPRASSNTLWQALSTLDGQINQVMDALATPNPANQLATVKIRARDLADRIISNEGKQLLKEYAASGEEGHPPVLRLHLMPGLDVVPWELLFDGLGFLGLNFQVARLPVVPAGPPDEDGKPHEVKRIASVLGENVLDDKATKRWKSTFDEVLNGANDVEVWRRPTANDWPNASNIVDDAWGDIVHITAHGITEGDERFWTLNHLSKAPGVRLFPSDAKTFQVGQTFPLVFANACASAGVGAAGAAMLKTLAEGFGSTYYDTGARSFIGTFAPVTQTMAVEFARRFFKQLLGKQLPVGEALLATKKEFDAEGGADPSWLFYCLYGDPSARFILPGGH